jgi:uncharacterized protein YegL
MNQNANALIIRQKALIENPDARVPICLVLDASPSMSGIVAGDLAATGEKRTFDGQEWSIVTGDNIVTRMDELNAGLNQFFQELLEDASARRAAEVCVVAFASDAEIIRDFAPLSQSHLGMSLQVSKQDGTSLGAGVGLALQLLEQRKGEYKNAGVDYYQPWLVVITDGQPTDDTHRQIAPEIRKLVEAKKLTIFPIAVGDLQDVSQLAVISPGRQPLKLRGAKFRELFQWLSRSVARVSSSIPGENVPLDKDGLEDWANL